MIEVKVTDQHEDCFVKNEIFCYIEFYGMIVGTREKLKDADKPGFDRMVATKLILLLADKIKQN
jgi:hypothetical protein